MNILRYHRISDPRVVSEYIDLFITQSELDAMLGSETKAIQWSIPDDGTLIRLRVFEDAESAARAHEQVREEQNDALAKAGERVSETEGPSPDSPAIYLPGNQFKKRRTHD